MSNDSIIRMNYGTLTIPPVRYTTRYVKRKAFKGWFWEAACAFSVLSCGPFWTKRGAMRNRGDLAWYLPSETDF